MSPTTVVAVGTYTSALYVFFVSRHTGILSRDSTTVFGWNQEAMVMVPDPSCNTEATILAIKNNCACSVSNGRSEAACCNTAGRLVSARLSANEWGAKVHSPVSEIALNVSGPIHMTAHPSGLIGIANFIGGYANLVGPLDVATGALGSTSMRTTKLADRSLMHQMTSDPKCGPGRRLLGIDADYPAVLVIDPADASILGIVRMPMRTRRLILHPTLPVAYVIYEGGGKVAQWSWPRCEAWLNATSVAAPPTEVAHFLTAPQKVDPSTLNVPSSFAISADGRFAYTCTRTAFTSMYKYSNADTAKVGVFAVDGNGTLIHLQWFDTGGYNTRDCRLAADDDLLLTVDVITSKLHVFGRDAETGHLSELDSKEVPHPTMIQSWTLGSDYCHIGSAATAPRPAPLRGGSGLSVALGVLVALVLVTAAKRAWAVAHGRRSAPFMS